MGALQAKAIPLGTYSSDATGEIRTPYSTRRHPNYPDGVLQPPPDLQTGQDLYLQSIRKHGPRDYIGWRRVVNGVRDSQFTFISYDHAFDLSKHFGAGLGLVGVGQGVPVCILAENRLEWFLTIDASYLFGFTLIALYDTFSPDALAFSIANCAAKHLVTSGKNLGKIASLNESVLGQFTDIVVLESPGAETDAAIAQLTAAGIRVSLFDDVVARGRAVSPIVFASIAPQDLAYVCYSSGTTGFPKGVMISHRCFISNLLGIYPEGVPTTFNVHISYLPLCHVFERMCSSCALHHGGRIGIFSGDVRLLTDDLMALHPTVMIVVPRVLQRIADKVTATLNESSPLKRFVFESAFSLKRWLLARDLPAGVLDTIVFNKIRRLLGGQMTMIVNGGAKLLPELHERIQVITGWPVRPGYGLSEGGSGNVIVPARIPLIKLGSSGYPLANVELRILPVPDFDAPGEGEILMGGSGLCDGYLNDPEATAALFTDETKSWIHTGDIGRFDELNGLVVLDRMHSIFKLSQGEFVAADILASFFELAELVQNCFVFGDSTRPNLVGIIIPAAPSVARWLGREALTQEELAQQCENPALVAAIRDQIDNIARERRLLGFQKLTAFKLVVDEWSVENGALSPTFKPRRKELSARYREEILRLYGEKP